MGLVEEGGCHTWGTSGQGRGKARQVIHCLQLVKGLAVRCRNATYLETTRYIESDSGVCVSSGVGNFSFKACTSEQFLKISHEGQEVRDAVAGCELCSPMGFWGFLSCVRNLNELIW